jgi:hypothetical protein
MIATMPEQEARGGTLPGGRPLLRRITYEAGSW